MIGTSVMKELKQAYIKLKPYSNYFLFAVVKRAFLDRT